MIRKTVDLYVLYTLIRRLSTPFTEWNAYKIGLIDDKGNFLVSKNDRTQEQKDELSYFDMLVLNLKKLLMKVPYANSRLATYAAALFLIKEGVDITSDSQVQHLTEEFVAEMDGVPTNNIGSGAIADHENRGIGTKKKVIRRRKLKSE